MESTAQISTSARYYNCARCKSQVIICRKCDRGNIYCGRSCSKEMRVKSHRAANKKYQNTSKGRQNNAKRQRRHRERQKKKITDHASPISPSHDVLPDRPNEPKKHQEDGQLHCHFCGEVVIHLRSGFLSHDFDVRPPPRSSWPLGP